MKGKIVLTILLLMFVILQCAGQEKLIVNYEFYNSGLNDWIIEGEGKAYIKNDKLILEPLHYGMLKAMMDEGKVSLGNNQKEYEPYLIDAMTKEYGNNISRYYTKNERGDSTFLGGHFNFWNKKYPSTDNFAIEFEFKSLSPAPLQMIMFCASGVNGESIFSPSMLPRYGLSTEIMHSTMQDYRISYFHPVRKTANLRRAPGRKLVAKGIDAVSSTPDRTYLCRVERRGKTIKYFVDGKLVLSYDDAKPLKGGHWGFRLMTCAKGEYDNIKLFSLSLDINK